ncbi:hypothetical protein C8R44DRAFT_882689 [Mycena epipterygia]|nr:hypothetical protein C8R44DRAFT_882689 [Mycena epipterygia]
MQRFSTRHKWLFCFDAIQSLVFVLNPEDYEPHRMRGAIAYFFGYVYYRFSQSVVHLDAARLSLICR